MDEFLNAKLQPYNEEAENAVIGAMLIDPDSAITAFESLVEEDFYKHENKAIFAAMESLFETSVPIDVVTVCERLSQNRALDALGGAEYVVALADGVITTGNVSQHIEIIKDKSLLRKLITASAESNCAP